MCRGLPVRKYSRKPEQKSECSNCQTSVATVDVEELAGSFFRSNRFLCLAFEHVGVQAMCDLGSLSCLGNAYLEVFVLLDQVGTLILELVYFGLLVFRGFPGAVEVPTVTNFFAKQLRDLILEGFYLGGCRFAACGGCGWVSGGWPRRGELRRELLRRGWIRCLPDLSRLGST